MEGSMNRVCSKKYNCLIGLGYNCEMAFQYKRIFGGIESDLFNWAYILDNYLFLEALGDLDGLFSEDVTSNGTMWITKAYQIAFHGKMPREELYDETNQLIPEKAAADLKELRERVNYLVGKFTKKITGKSGRILFLHKLRSKLNAQYNATFVQLLNKKNRGYLRASNVRPFGCCGRKIFPRIFGSMRSLQR